ncbi:hypothetical protein [Nakamurella endophytica]|uniref:Uncharacterized protein n=1 Tax=Nakamurella endophytica TaxID=1748367 RepID=A0A917SU49_9ACTN|nr:hypothetical protein [Nakamurella endophytica]GGL97306.1 hypothetical protein GCM10011594_16280 [Nakamurella endophytica]
MARSWASRVSRRPADTAAQAAQDGAVAAFLDLDTRQSYVADAIAAVAEVAGPAEVAGTEAALTRAWAATAQQCLDATAQYLSVSDRYSMTSTDGRPTGVDPAAAQHAFVEAHRKLADAAAAVDAFYRSHATELERGRSARAATPRIAEQARAAATAAERALTGAEADEVAYPSVLAAAGELVSALAALNLAEPAGRTGPIRTAAAAVESAAADVQERISTARGLLPAVRASRSSVRTRIEAVTTRLQGLPATRSALLREFSAACSRDLTGVDGRARAAVDRAEEEWRRSGTALDGGRPEEAAERLTAARAALTEAEGLEQSLVERLRVLRRTRDDPEAAAKSARFRLRDAQLLVVDRGLVREWGSVLDAQVARIDRAVAELTGPHPDYWAYLQALAAVESFVKGVVERVRSESR